MTFQEEIGAVQARITQARAERNSAQATGMQKKYLEACSRLSSLEGDLERLRQRGLRAFAAWQISWPPPARRTRSAPPR